MNFFKLEGIIINRKEFGEGDYYLTVFTEKLGKLTLIIKGIKKSKKRDQNSVDLLTKSEFSVYRNKERLILSDAAALESFENLRKDIFKCSLAFYLAGILNAILVEGERKRELYQLFQKSLNYLNDNEDEAKIYLLIAYFLNKIAGEEGVAYNFKAEVPRLQISEKSEEYEILKEISENRIKKIINRDYKIENIRKAIYIYEKYLNVHLDLHLDLKKYLLEA